MGRAELLVLLTLLCTVTTDEILGAACQHLTSQLSPKMLEKSDLLQVCAAHNDTAVRAACVGWSFADARLLLSFARFDNAKMGDILCPIFGALPLGSHRHLGDCSWLEMAGCAAAIAGAVAACGFVFAHLALDFA